MSRNWIRKWKVTVDQTVFEGTGEDPFGGLRVKFIVYKQIVQSPQGSWVRVYNITKDNMKKLVQAVGKKVTIEAGYKDNCGKIYEGPIVYAISGRESPTDTYVDFFCQDMASQTTATLSKTYDAGSKQKDHVDDIVKSMDGVEKGKIQGLSDEKYPKPVTYHGMSSDIMRTIAKSNDAAWWVDFAKLHHIPLKELKNGIFGQVELNEDTGLIGMPQMTNKGIIVTALINPAYALGVQLKIDSSKINLAEWGDLSPEGMVTSQKAYTTMGIADGVYTIETIEWRGDTHGQEWYAIMSCHGSITGSQQNEQALPAQKKY